MKIKYLLSFAVVLGMGLVTSPDSVALTMNEVSTPDMQAGCVPLVQYSRTIGKSKSIDPGMLICPKYNCDPEMCITTVPNIDPGIMLKDQSK